MEPTRPVAPHKRPHNAEAAPTRNQGPEALTLRALSPDAGEAAGMRDHSLSAASGMTGDALSALAAQTVGVVSALAGSIIAARLLGATGRGILALVTLWVSLFALLVPLSSGYGLVFEVRRSRVRLEQALSGALGMSAVFGGVAVGLAVLGTRWLPLGFLDGVPFSCVLIGAIALPAMIFNGLSGLVLTAAGRLRQASFIAAVGSVIAVMLLTVLLLGLRLGVEGAVLASSLASFAAMIITLVWLRSYIRPAFIIRSGLWTSSVRFGAKLHGGMIAQWANYSLDRFLVNVFLGPGAVGVYTVAAALGERLWMLPGAVSATLLSRTGGDACNDAEITARACRSTFWLMFSTCTAVGLAAPVLVRAMFGSEFAPASLVLRLLLPGVLILTVGKVIAPYVCNRGRPSTATRISVGALGLTVVLNALLIPVLGIAGSAIASSLSYAANGTAFAAVFVRMSGLHLRDLVGPPEVNLRGLGARCAKLVSAALAGGA